MRVFISWSKEPSRTIAAALGSWLGGLVQAADPWVSDEEIASGKRWRDEIATVLNETDFGIICLTRANQHNPWLMFEAGALAKHLTAARVIPLYIDLDAAEVTGPLADWQGRPLDRDGMARIVYDINAATPKPVAKEALQRLFDRMWDDFAADLATAKEKAPETDAPRRSAEDMLEELIDRVRRLERRQRPRRRLNPGDTLMLPSGESVIVPESPDARQELEDLLELMDLRIYTTVSGTSPGTVHARASVGGAATTTPSALVRLFRASREPANSEESPEGPTSQADEARE